VTDVWVFIKHVLLTADWSVVVSVVTSDEMSDDASSESYVH